MEPPRYCCPCGEALTIEGVTVIEKADMAFGHPQAVNITYECACSPDGRQVARFPFKLAPLKLIIGESFKFPWVNRLRPTLTPEEIEREVSYARFELGCIQSGDEFLWWVDAYTPLRRRYSPSGDDNSSSSSD